MIIGSRCRDSLIKMVEELGGNILYNLTCTGIEPPFRLIGLLEDPIEAYTNILLDQYPLHILKLETDYTDNSEVQIKTRIQAFIESLKKSNRELKSQNLENV